MRAAGAQAGAFFQMAALVRIIGKSGGRKMGNGHGNASKG